MDGWKMSFLLGFPIFRGYVKLRGGNFFKTQTPPLGLPNKASREHSIGQDANCQGKTRLDHEVLGCPVGS